MAPSWWPFGAKDSKGKGELNEAVDLTGSPSDLEPK